jgi:hypothetical protein
MSQSEKMLSVEEVLELVPGDEQNATWVNPGFVAVVRNIKATKTKKGGTMNICTLGSQTGSAEISMTVFSAVKFKEGDLIEISGQGLRRTEYNQLQQVSLGKATEIHVLGASAHHQEQQERRAHSEPAINGERQRIEGQTVGMAMKEALLIVGRGDCGAFKPTEAAFWQHVHTQASQIIRLSKYIEAGNLAPKVGAPATSAPADRSPARSEPAKATSKPTPGPDGSAFPKNTGDDEDVPF